MSAPAGSVPVAIGLSAMVVAIQDGEAVALTVRLPDARTREAAALPGLPSGPFDPAGHRTFELALRAFVTEQTGFQLGYVEQLYTFGDEGRDAPLADFGGRHGPGRACSPHRWSATRPATTTATPPPRARWCLRRCATAPPPNTGCRPGHGW